MEQNEIHSKLGDIFEIPTKYTEFCILTEITANETRIMF